MKKSNSIKLSEMIITAISLIDKSEATKEFHIENYSNGREQGYSITNFAAKEIGTFSQAYLKVSFSLFRSSDSIVIYTGSVNDFTDAGNLPTDEVYRNSKSFDYKQIFEAAEFIIFYLTTGTK